MNKRRRKQRIAQRIRQLVIMERRFALVLRRHRRAIGRRMAQQTGISAMTQVVEQHEDELRTVARAWLKRVVDMFGKENIRYIEDRIGRGQKANSYDVFLNVISFWIETQATGMVKTISRHMLDAARDVLADAVANGWGNDKTAREITKAVGGTTANNMRISRTELHNAAGVAGDESARATGLDMIKEWGATNDKRTRDSHAEADGQRREMDQPFTVGGAALMFAGDPNGPADEIINCRCGTFYHPRINGVVYD